MPIPVQCDCGHYWQASERSAGNPVVCSGCGVTLLVPVGPAVPPVMPQAYAPARPEPPPPRGMAITGGILALLAGLGHAFIGVLLLLLAAFLAAFVHSMFGGNPAGDGATNEAYGILGLLFLYAGLSALSCVPAILTIMGRYWAVVVTASFQALLTLGLLFLTVQSGDGFVAVVAAYSGMTTLFCLLGIRQARDYGQYLLRRSEAQFRPPSPPHPNPYQ